METFTKLFERFLVFVYHCFDRIVIQGYLPLLTPGDWPTGHVRRPVSALPDDLSSEMATTSSKSNSAAWPLTRWLISSACASANCYAANCTASSQSSTMTL